MWKDAKLKWCVVHKREKVWQQLLIKMKVSDRIKVLMYTWNIFTGKLFISFWKVQDWKNHELKDLSGLSKRHLLSVNWDSRCSNPSSSSLFSRVAIYHQDLLKWAFDKEKELAAHGWHLFANIYKWRVSWRNFLHVIPEWFWIWYIWTSTGTWWSKELLAELCHLCHMSRGEMKVK